MEFILLAVYISALSVLFGYALMGLWMVWRYVRSRPHDPRIPDVPDEGELPVVTVQLPLYNEMHVVERLIEAVCGLDYPRDRLEIQVLDDSTDGTSALISRQVALHPEVDLKHIRRSDRSGYKAGALQHGAGVARGEFLAIFDADFVPEPDFLRRTIPHLLGDSGIGMVQTRWEHINHDQSLLTRVQAMALDAHFAMEQQMRNRSGHFINFNGTAGVWRRECILDAGNWQADTLTEDLDLSFRAQLNGWRFLYLNDVTAPAELPSDISGLKSQQFRWTKGAIETARKHLAGLWRSEQPIAVKLQSTLHLTSNLVFPFILLVAVLNVPVVWLKVTVPSLGILFNLLSVFVLATAASMFFHGFAQHDIRRDWRRRMRVFPLFLAGTMGLAVNNTRAVLEALFGYTTEFKRTPKYNILGVSDTWKQSRYREAGIGVETVIELLLAAYFLGGIVFAVWHGEFAAIPFQLMFLAGFASVGLLTLRNAWSVRALRADAGTLGGRDAVRPGGRDAGRPGGRDAGRPGRWDAGMEDVEVLEEGGA